MNTDFPPLERDADGDMAALDDMEGQQVEVPGENDVLCGRGGSINSHKGNEQFRDLVEKRKRVYLTARFKREKRLIASSIVSEIRAMDPPGRFLARKGNKESGFWYDIGDEKARDKTSQALRENAPSIRAEIETEINEQRAEMKRTDDEDHLQKPPPSYAPHAHAGHPHYHQPPPPQHPSYQSYWDWYRHFYGYSPHQMPPPPHYSPHTGQPVARTVAPVHQPSHSVGYWEQTVVPATAREKTGEEFKDDGMHEMLSQEEDDRRLAMELQQQEKAALLEARKAKYKSTLANRSNAYVHHVPHARSSGARRPQPKHIPRGPAPFEAMDSTDMTQEQRDHRLAVALQEQEDKALTSHLEAFGDSSRRTSRSNAYSQATRVVRDTVMSSDRSHSYGPLEQVVPSSFVSWMASDSDKKPKATTQRRRSVQFKEDDISLSHVNHTPVSLQRQSSTASADRLLQPEVELNASLLSQVASHILGSWENGSSSYSGMRATRRGSLHSLASSHDDMETEGLEVQLRDPRDETSMPPPSPRVQIDWPARAGNGASWLPDTLNATWASGTTSVNPGISPVNSLEMDGSNTNGSIGGVSLCHLFDHDESLQRALREVPSWERSMRSKSPLSIASVEESDISMIRVREMKLFRPATSLIRQSGSGDMDWEDHPDQR